MYADQLGFNREVAEGQKAQSASFEDDQVTVTVGSDSVTLPADAIGWLVDVLTAIQTNINEKEGDRA